MAATFAIVATLAAVGGGWAVRANAIGRWAALILLALFGIALVFPSVSDRLTRPLVALGSRLSERQPGEKESIWSSAVLGVATGLLWAPCAGPILGIIFTAAALQGASFNTTLLLLAYALGAATSLALALVIGGKVFARMKKSLGASERIRQALGVLVLIGVAAIAFGLDTRVLSKLSSAQTASFETGLARKLGASQAMGDSATRTGKMGELVLPVEGQLPPLDGLGPWFNSPPLTREQLKGKVVLIDFWTYSCINCLRTLPYLKAWDAKYRKDGLVIIGVHAPEFAFERDPANVAKAIADLGIRYPVALDNRYVLWSALKNQYWPAHYFVDAQGRIRFHHHGEGEYALSERVIRQLLAEAGHAPRDAAMAQASAAGAEAAAAMGEIKSPETYIGYARAERFVSPGGLAARCCQDLYGRAASAQRLVARRPMARCAAKRPVAGARREDQLPLPRPRPPPRARLGQRQAGALPRDARRPGAWRRRRHRRQARRQRRGDRAAPLPIGAAEGRGPRPYVHH